MIKVSFLYHDVSEYNSNSERVLHLTSDLQLPYSVGTMKTVLIIAALVLPIHMLVSIWYSISAGYKSWHRKLPQAFYSYIPVVATGILPNLSSLCLTCHHYTCILLAKLQYNGCIKVFVLIFCRKKCFNLRTFIFPDFLSLLLSKSIVPSVGSLVVS